MFTNFKFGTWSHLMFEACVHVYLCACVHVCSCAFTVLLERLDGDDVHSLNTNVILREKIFEHKIVITKCYNFCHTRYS